MTLSPPVSDAASPVLLVAKPDKKQIAVFLKNNSGRPFCGAVRYFVEQTDGTRRGELRDAVNVPPNSETQLIFFDRRELREKRDLLRMILTDNAGREVCRTFWQSEKLRSRHLHDPKLTVSPFLRAGRVCVTVRAACFAKDVTLSCGHYTFSENGFSLFANEEKTVELQEAKADLTEEITVTSAFDRR